jgi:hypothetical protein
MSNDRTNIFVEVQPSVFERRKVETDYQEGNTAVIKSGLEARRARDREGRGGSQRLTGSKSFNSFSAWRQLVVS